MTDIVADPRGAAAFPALVESATVVGSVQIRNRATLAGNICNASPAADTAPALLAYGAVVNLVSAGGPRRIARPNSSPAPGGRDGRRRDRRIKIDLPVPSDATGAAFGRITRRRGVDLATINLCSSSPARASPDSRTAPSGRDRSSSKTRVACWRIGGRARRAGRRARPDALVREPDLGCPADRHYREAMLRVMSRRALVTRDRRSARQAQDGSMRPWARRRFGLP